MIEDCFRDRNAMFLRHRLAEARDCYLLKRKGDVEREVLCLGASVLMEDASLEPVAKTNGFILLGVLLTIAVVWQAAWHIVAQIHLLVEGIAPPTPPRNSHVPPDVITGA